jgi:predicted ATPase
MIAIPPAIVDGATRGARGRWPAAVPQPTTGPFVDRDAELTELRSALDDGRDEGVLVTLTGPAGAGKTRLANELALHELEARAGRVAWVSLGSIVDASLVPAAIADALGLAETPGDDIVREIARALDDDAAQERDAGRNRDRARPPRRALLVLDALAQLVPDVGFVDAIRSAAPGLAILTTSRRPLRLPGETTIEVGPLPVPGPNADAAAVAASPSVRVLLAPSTGTQQQRAVTASNARTLAQLATQLDGLPLALELAGAALRRLSPGQLLDRLSTTQPGQTSAVLDTLAATLDRSIELVSPSAQVVYRRLGVFVGPIDRALAGAVVDRGVMLGLSAPEAGVAAAIDELLEASLLRPVGGSATGATGDAFMLETVRAHARRRLEATAELMTAEWAHAHEVLDRVEALAERLVPVVDAAALAELDRLAPETATALDTAAARGGDDVLVRLCAALAEWWRLRGRLTEGRLRVELALRRTTGRRDIVRVRAVHGAASLAYRHGDLDHARGLLDEAIRLAVELDDRRGEAAARNLLGLVAFDQGRMTEALEMAEAGLGIRRELADDAEVAASLNTLGAIHHFRGNLAPAAAALEECLGIRARLGDESGSAVCLANLALVDRDLGALDRAVERLEAALDTRRRLGDRLREAVTVHNLGLVRLEQGRLDEARASIESALAMARDVGDRVEIGNALADLSLIARDEGRIGDAWELATEAVALAARIGARGVLALALEAAAALAGGEDPADGARLWAAAGSLRGRTGYVLLHADRRRLMREIDAAQSRADPAVWERAWTDGGSLDERAAAHLALERAVATAPA